MDDYTPLLEQLLRQEQELQFSKFSNETALQLGLAILERARKLDKKITVDIRLNGQLLFLAKMDGNGPENDRWITRKINTVQHFGHSSYYMHVLYKSWNTTLQDNAFVDPLHYAAEGGSFPLLIRGVGVVGTITVSGLTGVEDHEMVVNALEPLLRGES